MRKVIIASIFIGAIVSMSWYGYAKTKKLSIGRVDAVNDIKFKLANQDDQESDLDRDEKAILQELIDLFRGLDSANAAFFMEGSIEMADPADSVQANQSIPFTFYNNGSISFSRYGSQTEVNTEAYYAMADIDFNKIIVGVPKKTGNAGNLPVASFTKLLKGEGYQVSKKVKEAYTTIQLLCENHISCKEIRVDFHTATRKPVLLHYRLTDLDHPLESQYDKTVSVKISNWLQGKEAVKDVSVPELIQFDNSSLSAGKGFEGYEIINLSNQ